VRFELSYDRIKNQSFLAVIGQPTPKGIGSFPPIELASHPNIRAISNKLLVSATQPNLSLFWGEWTLEALACRNYLEPPWLLIQLYLPLAHH
jgi:hypothetical protein